MRSLRPAYRAIGAMCIAFVAVLTTTACITTNPDNRDVDIIEIDDSGVADCEFLGTIFKSVTAGLLFGSTALEAAHNQVLDDAAGRGATHVIWMGQGGGGMTQNASAKAYRCELPAEGDTA